MTQRVQTQILFHGAVILLGGMLTGFPLTLAIVNGAQPETIHAWAVTHTSLTSTAILLIALGAAARYLVLGTRESALLPVTLISSAYVLCIALIVTAASGHRGLALVGPVPNLILHVSNLAGVAGALAAGIMIVRGAYAGLSLERRRPLGRAAVTEAA